jgi:hypothetical protein
VHLYHYSDGRRIYVHEEPYPGEKPAPFCPLNAHFAHQEA